MHKPSSLRDYLIAILIAAALFGFFSLYLLFRRGYFFDAPPTADVLYVPNKALAGTGTVMLSLVFLIGPIARYFDRFDNWLGLRKEIGIVATFVLLGHVIVSYFFLPLKFPHSKVSLASLEFAAGLVGIALLVFLFLISFKKAIALLGAKRWWFMQRWGLRLVVLLTIIHVFNMKWAGWMKWLKVGGGNPTPELARPNIPGLGLYVGMFLAWVVIVRLFESTFIFKSFGITTKEVMQDEVLRNRGRRFFLWSFWVLVAAYVFVITRWM